jgi:hypothetical protein
MSQKNNTWLKYTILGRREGCVQQSLKNKIRRQVKISRPATPLPLTFLPVGQICPNMDPTRTPGICHGPDLNRRLHGKPQLPKKIPLSQVALSEHGPDLDFLANSLSEPGPDSDQPQQNPPFCPDGPRPLGPKLSNLASNINGNYPGSSIITNNHDHSTQGGDTGAFREDRSSCTLVRNYQIRFWFQGAGVSHINVCINAASWWTRRTWSEILDRSNNRSNRSSTDNKNFVVGNTKHCNTFIV